MANQIDAVKEFSKEISKITDEMKTLHAEVLALSKSSREAASSFNQIRTPKEANDNLKKINSEAEKLAKLAEKQRLAEIKLARAREKAFDDYEKRLERQRKAQERQVNAESNLRQRLQRQREAEEKALARATALSDKLGRAMNIATKKRNDLARVIQDLNIKRELGIRLSAQEERVLAQSRVAFERYDRAIRNTNQSIGRFQENVGNYPSVLQPAARSLAAFTASLTLASAGLAIGFIAKDAFERIRDFDKSMQNLSGTLRVNRKDVKDLEDNIISVAGASVRTSNEIASLANSLITLGKSKEEVKALLQPVTDLSLGLNVAADEAGEFLIQMLNSFGAGIDEAEKYADTIATIRTSTSLDFQKMRDSFQYIAPIAKILNKDLAYTGAVVGILADNGLKAESAGRLLSTSIQKLSKNGKTLQDALDEINQAQSEGIEGLELLSLANDLFGVQSAKVGIILANNSNIIDKNAQAIRDNGGALKDLVGEQLKSLDASLKILSSRWEEYILKQNNAADGSGKLSKVINYLSENLDTIVSTLIIVIKWFGIYKAVQLAGAAATVIATAANTAYRIGLIALRGGISKVIVSMRLMRLATAATGIGLFLVLLGSAYELFQTFKEGAKDATDEMKKLNKEMDNFNKVGKNYKKITDSYKQGLEQIGKAIEGQDGIIDRVGEKLKQYAENDYQFNAIHVLEAERLIMETKEKDIDSIKKRINEAGATFSERQKIYLLNEIAGYQSLNKVIKENEEFLDKKNAKESAGGGGRSKAIELSKLLTKTSNALAETEIRNAFKITEAQIKQYATVNNLKKKAGESDKDFEKRVEDEIRSTREVTKEYIAQFIALKQLRKLAAEPFNENNEILDSDKVRSEADRIIDDINRIAEARRKLFENKLLRGALSETFDLIEQVTGIGGGKLNRLFDSLETNGKASFEQVAEIASASFSVMGDISDGYFQGKIDKYNEDIAESNEYYDNLLANENNSAEQNKRLEQDKKAAEKRLRAEQKKEKEKQFIANKAFAIAEIAINTAVSVVEALPNVPLSIAVGVLGAIQAGVVLAQPMPAFAEGGTMGHDGAMMINDHHSGRLEVVERNGKYLMTDQKDAIVQGKKGDIIHKDAGAYFSGLSDNEVLKDAKNHSMIATINHQNNVANRLNNKKVADVQKIHTDRLVKAILSKRTHFNVNNNVSLSDDLRYRDASNEF